MAFKTWLASKPVASLKKRGGLRKVRWVLEGNNKGKSGGVRVIYFNEHGGKIWLLITYTKSKFDSLPKKFLRKLKEEIENA